MLVKKRNVVFIMLFCCVIISLIVVIPYKFSSVNSESFFKPEIITPSDDETENEESNQQEQTKEELPIYTNGANCLFDAEKRLLEADTFKISGDVTVSAMGVEQKSVQTKIKTADTYIEELKSYSSSSFGKKDYRRTEQVGDDSYKYTKGNILNDDMTLDNDSLVEKIITKNEVMAINPFIFNPIDTMPQKDNGRITKFDRVTYDNYYLVGFSFDVSKLDDAYANAIKQEGGLNNVEILSISVDVLISKKTGLIKQFQKNEVYTLAKGPISGKSYAKHVFKFEY